MAEKKAVHVQLKDDEAPAAAAQPSELVKMAKFDKDKGELVVLDGVHRDAVEDHKRLGWFVVKGELVQP